MGAGGGVRVEVWLRREGRGPETREGSCAGLENKDLRGNCF